MKLPIKLTIAFSIIIASFTVSFGQKQSLSDYFGKWRWVGGNDDTLLILLKPFKPSVYTNKLAYVSTEVIGFHTYIEHGKIVESNMHLESDTITNFVSLSGRFMNDQLQFGMRDFTRDDYFTGTFRIIKEFPTKAILDLPYSQEKISWERKRLFPPGRTVPNNIVLEKIE